MNTYILILFTLFISYLLYKMFVKNDTNRAMNIFKTYFNDKKYNILDFGCGSCCNSTILENMGHQVTSLDIIDLSNCKKPQLYDGKRIPFGDKSFDIVLCSFVLHHTSDWYELLKEMKRVSKYIIILENTPENKLDDWFVKQHSTSHWGGVNCLKCFKTNEEWIETFENLNLSIKKIEKIPRWYFPFSEKPYFYPVVSMVYILETENM